MGGRNKKIYQFHRINILANDRKILSWDSKSPLGTFTNNVPEANEYIWRRFLKYCQMFIFEINRVNWKNKITSEKLVNI